MTAFADGDCRVGPHSADLELIFRAGTLKDLFSTAARSTLDYIVPGPGGGGRRLKTVEIEAPNREELLVAWLNELLYRLEVEEVKYDRFRFHRFGNRRLRAELSGAAVELARSASGPGIKAATYHELSLKKTGGRWEARVIFDL